MNTGEHSNVRVEMVVTDAATSQQVLTGVSRVFLLPKGVKQLRPADVMPITYNAGNSGYAIDPRPDGFLPTGVFTICYSVIKVESDAPEKLNEDCETVHIEPISPPQLVVPADNDQLAVTRPMFTWLPPAPVNAGSGVQYDWTLVEVQATQSPADAVQQNIPVLSRQNVAMTSFQYPLAMPELDTGKLYAWRITARNGGLPIANSETWSFRVKKNNDHTAAGNRAGAFARLYASEDAAYVICEGILRFEYNNESNAGTVGVSVADISSAQHKPVKLDSTDYTTHYGQNFLQIDMQGNKGLIDGHMYLLRLTDARQQNWFLKFEYRKPKGRRNQL